MAEGFSPACATAYDAPLAENKIVQPRVKAGLGCLGWLGACQSNDLLSSCHELAMEVEMEAGEGGG